MTSAVLYGTTSDNELRPVRVTDSGEFVTDGGGGGDWYANLYVGGTQGDPSISLLSNGVINAGSSVFTGVVNCQNQSGTAQIVIGELNSAIYATDSIYLQPSGETVFTLSSVGDLNVIGDVYARKFIPADGYDVSKIGTALSTIHDVIESVDDLQGLKNLFHLLLDNLKTDPIPPTP